MKTNWKQKLTSRKLWAAIVSFVALLVVALGGSEAQAAQVTAIIMAGATVMAYIIGEGLVDAASAGATINVNDDAHIAAEAATIPPSTPIVGALDSSTVVAAVGAAQAAGVKQSTAESGPQA